MPTENAHDHDADHDDFVDGCDLDFRQDVLDDAEADLFVLFADALDPNSPQTVAESAAQWKAIFS